MTCTRIGAAAVPRPGRPVGGMTEYELFACAVVDGPVERGSAEAERGATAEPAQLVTNVISTVPTNIQAGVGFRLLTRVFMTWRRYRPAIRCTGCAARREHDCCTDHLALPGKSDTAGGPAAELPWSVAGGGERRSCQRGKKIGTAVPMKNIGTYIAGTTHTPVVPDLQGVVPATGALTEGGEQQAQVNEGAAGRAVPCILIRWR